MDQWAFSAGFPNGPQPLFAALPVEPDDFLDLTEKQEKTIGAIITSFEGKIIEYGTKSSLPGNTGKGNKYAKLVVIGLKIVNALISDDDQDTPRDIIGGVDVTELFELARPTTEVRIVEELLVQELGKSLSRAGFIVLDPVWLADPKA